MNEIIVIMGPSGSGKTTLANNLSLNNNIGIPKHCTTRARRSDDIDGFYRFLLHEEFKKKLLDDEFLVASGDGPYVDKKFGNFYGVLKEDCIKEFEKSDKIILMLSYKDIGRLIKLKENGFKIKIINLTFTDIEQGVRERISNDKRRNHTQSDIEKRVNNALSDAELFLDKLAMYTDLTLYTDKINIEETYQQVCKKLVLKN